MQSTFAVRDLYTRTHSNNPFELKPISHNASHQSLLAMAHAFILNKMALIPFESDQKLTQLYKTSLESLIDLPGQYFKSDVFVDNLTQHLCNWQKHMCEFGSWPHTRAAFFSIQEKVKKNQDLFERVIFKRALLEPNKQQFLSRALSQSFKGERIKMLIDQYQGKRDRRMKEEHVCDLPRDILFEDRNECWMRLEEEFKQMDRRTVEDYLEEYANRGISAYLRNRLKLETTVESIIEGLDLRQNIYQKILGKQNPVFSKYLSSLARKQTNPDFS